jgi:hypothetical protein
MLRFHETTNSEKKWESEMRALAKRLGANYVWGVANYTLGVACGASLAGFMVGLKPFLFHLLGVVK